MPYEEFEIPEEFNTEERETAFLYTEVQKMFYEFDMAMMMEENTAGEPARGNV